MPGGASSKSDGETSRFRMDSAQQRLGHHVQDVSAETPCETVHPALKGLSQRLT